jgi:hypothetical protein
VISISLALNGLRVAAGSPRRPLSNLAPTRFWRESFVLG